MFEWGLFCGACSGRVIVERKHMTGEVTCPHCQVSALVNFGFGLPEEKFKPGATTVDYARDARKIFDKLDNAGLIKYKDSLDIKKHGYRVLIMMTHVIREMERRGLPCE